MQEVLRIVLYGLLAAASPTVLLATLGILAAERARLNGTVFMTGVLVGQSAAFTVVYLVGSTSSKTPRPEVNVYFELAAGIALLVLAWRLRHPSRSGESTRPSRLRGLAGSIGSDRTKAGLTRLTGVGPATLFGMALVFGVGAKRLAITILAAETVALGAEGGPDDFWLGLTYVVVASSIVWLPVSAYLILGSRSGDLIGRVRARIGGGSRRLEFWAALVGGVILVLAAAVRLAVQAGG